MNYYSNKENVTRNGMDKFSFMPKHIMNCLMKVISSRKRYSGPYFRGKSAGILHELKVKIACHMK